MRGGEGNRNAILRYILYGRPVNIVIIVLGVRIVNTSDASLVDEAALCEALKRGQVHAAALDVYNTEPFYRAHSTFTARTVASFQPIIVGGLTFPTSLSPCHCDV